MRGARGATLLVAASLALSLPGPAHAAPGRAVAFFLVDGLTFEDVLEAPTFRHLAGAGGVGLMTRVEGQELRIRDVLGPSLPPAEAVLVGVNVDDTSAAPREVRQVIAGLTAEEVLVVVAAPRAGERIPATPIIVARGRPDALLAARVPLGGLTSDTTRRPGLVAAADLGPTIRAFLDADPGGEGGSPIRVEGRAPVDLHRLYLESRRVAEPVGIAVLLFALTALLVGLGVVLWPGAPSRVAGAVAVWGLVGISFHVALLPGSWLPSYSPAAVVAAMGLVAAAVAGVALWARRWGPTVPVAVVAGIGLVLVVVDAALGWRSLLTPLIGGSALDGARFFGLGNSYAGLVLSAAVLVAALLRPVAGVVLLVLAALFAGLPFLGGDVGGALTMFAVAGLWWAFRIRGRLGPVELAGVVGVTAVGLGVLVGAHRLWPVSRHLTGAVAGPGGLAGAFEAFGGRLSMNLELTAATPAVWPALAMLPVGLAIAWGRPGPFAEPLRDRAWRHAAGILAVGAMLGYLWNDTFGLATVAFIYLSAALVYPALEARWRSG